MTEYKDENMQLIVIVECPSCGKIKGVWHYGQYNNNILELRCAYCNHKWNYANIPNVIKSQRERVFTS